MSWPLASFAIVFGVLLAGWLAYERSRPSARMAAVVGTLAAVAALGRDAFVAIPDVKPITAITLVVGYALGPLPGFTVGAVGMLASNIVLGQGSYTPWQMAAWGLVGLAGAALGRLSGRRMGRVGLALACALTAMGAKEIMNVYTWTLGASHSPAALLATAGVALPYDITDAVASFLFGLAFGPELARLLGRMRARMTVRWEPARPSTHPPAATPLVLLVLVCGGVYAAGCPARAGRAAVWRASTSTLPASTVTRHASLASTAARPASIVVWKTSRASTLARPAPVLARLADYASARASGARVDVSREISYLARAQNADGGFGAAKGRRSSELYSAWAAIGLAAAGRDSLALAPRGHTVLSSIDGEASTLQGAGDLERTILALRACGASAHRLPGGDPVARLLRFRSGDGSFGHMVNLTAFAVLALRAAGVPAGGAVVRDAARWLAHQQNRDGGFGYAARGTVSDVDDTGAALQGVVAASVPDGPVVSQAVAFLERAQDSDGGYPQERGGESNAQSTAWAVQGLLAAGREPRAVTRAGRSPFGYLETLIAPDGSVRYSATSAQTPVWVTAEALAALAGKPLPIAPVGRSSVEPAARSTGGAVGGRPGGRFARGGLASSGARAMGPKSAGAPRAQTHLNELAREAGMLIAVVLAPVLR